MRELRIEGYAGCRELAADGVSRWVMVNSTADGSTPPLVVRQLSADLSQRGSLRTHWLRAGEHHAQLRHPNLVQVIAAGLWEMRPGIAHSPLSGTSLSQLLEAARAEGQRLSLALAAYVAHSLLSVLAYAAGQSPGLLHLDVRAERVQVDPSGGVLLSEFGLWSLLEPTERTRRRLDAGELHQIAPEVVQSLPCDARADLFSVGSIAFEIVTGQRAFAGSTSLATAVEVAAGRRRALPERVSAPATFCAFIERLLSHRPEARYQSAAEALVSLSEFAGLIAQGRQELRARVDACAQPREPGVEARAEPREPDVQVPAQAREPSGQARAPEVAHRPPARVQSPAALAGVVTQFLFRPFQPKGSPRQVAPPPLFGADPRARTLAPDRVLQSEPHTLLPPPMSVGSRAPAAVAAAFPSFGSFVRASTAARAPVLCVGLAQESVGLAKESAGLANGSLAVVRGSGAVAHGSVGLAQGSVGLAHESVGLAQGSVGLAHESVGLAHELVGLARGSIGPAHELGDTPLLRAGEGSRSRIARPQRFAPSMAAHGSQGQAWRDPSRTVFFAKVYAQGKTSTQVSKLSVLAMVALCTVFGSAFVGALYLLYRVLR